MTSPLSRRAFVAGMTAAAALGSQARAAATSRIRAIAFDAFPIFNPARLTEVAQSFFGDSGKALAASWSTRLFSLTWLITAGGRYRPFEELAGTALETAARDLGLAVSPAARREMVDAYGRLEIWPDVPDALEQLRSQGLRLRFLSNLGAQTLERNMRANRISQFFEPPLSTDQVMHFKPSPLAYAMAAHAFRLPKRHIGFAAFAAWDAAGAAQFGFPTAWVNRSGAAPDALGPRPTHSGRGMETVFELLGESLRA